jgi:hypothetical protein
MAAAAPGTGGQEAPPNRPPPTYVSTQHLFRVITAEIKRTINNLKTSIDRGDQESVNNAVILAVQNLGNLDNVIVPALDDALNGINSQHMNIHVHRDTGTTERKPNDYGGLSPQHAINAFTFLHNPETKTINGIRQIDDSGTFGKIAFDNVGLNLDEIRTFETDGTISDDGLEPDYREGDFDLSDEGNRNLLQSRLINCQYLEILYLTKHEELMKIFAFTLNLYDKYTYAIKILLFVLKNLLEPVAPPGCPEPRQEPGERPTIRLPKALITNIKQLLKDQKQVQDVITRMRETVNTTVPELVNPTNAAATITPGNLMNRNNPPNPPH